MRSSRRQWSDEQVTAMRELYRGGMSVADIRSRFGGTDTAVREMLRGRNYADVPGWLNRAEWAKRMESARADRL